MRGSVKSRQPVEAFREGDATQEEFAEGRKTAASRQWFSKADKLLNQATQHVEAEDSTSKESATRVVELRLLVNARKVELSRVLKLAEENIVSMVDVEDAAPGIPSFTSAT